MLLLRINTRYPPNNGPPLQYSCLENPMDRGAWWAAVHGVAMSWTWLGDFTFTIHALEKEMATHSSVLAWRIPGTGEPGGMPSMGSHRVGHHRSDLAAADTQNENMLSKFSTTPQRHKGNEKRRTSFLFYLHTKSKPHNERPCKCNQNPTNLNWLDTAK